MAAGFQARAAGGTAIRAIRFDWITPDRIAYTGQMRDAIGRSLEGSGWRILERAASRQTKNSVRPVWNGRGETIQKVRDCK